MVENEIDLKITTLQYDNGGEYKDNDFKWYYDENDINMKKTVLGKPQHNGVAERMNKTLNE